MDRRTALAAAGAITLVVLTGTSAVAVNLGLLSGPEPAPAGELQPADPELATILVEPLLLRGDGVADGSPPATVPSPDEFVSHDDHPEAEEYEDEAEEYEDEAEEDEDEAEEDGDEAEKHGDEAEHEYEGWDDDD